jgi:precorrin-2 dehydrogenase/sirohydrochlorin ferrochelatase
MEAAEPKAHDNLLVLMDFFPVFLDLSACSVLVFGAGQVGRRKIASLLPCAPRAVLVLDSRRPAAEHERLFVPPVFFRLVAQGYRVSGEDLADARLVFAASSDRAANQALAALCRDKKIFCNVADAPDQGSFQVPAHYRLGNLSAAFSTGGLSPALAARISRESEAWLGGRFGPLLTVMGRLRPLVLGLGRAPEENARLFRALVQSPLDGYLTGGEFDAAAALLRELLPASLHHCLGDLLHGPL